VLGLDVLGFLVETVDDCIVFDCGAEEVGGATWDLAVDVVSAGRGMAGEVTEETREALDVVVWVIPVEEGGLAVVFGFGVATWDLAIDVVGAGRGMAVEVAEEMREAVDVVVWVILVEGGGIACAVIGGGVCGFTGGMDEGVIAVS